MDWTDGGKYDCCDCAQTHEPRNKNNILNLWVFITLFMITESIPKQMYHYIKGNPNKYVRSIEHPNTSNSKHIYNK